MIGQAIGLPPTMLVFSAFGVVITSASAIVFGEAIWDPAVLLGKFSNPITLVLALVGLVVASLSVNIAANTVSRPTTSPIPSPSTSASGWAE